MASFTVMSERTPGSFEIVLSDLHFQGAEGALRYVLSTTPPLRTVEHYLVIPDEERLNRAHFFTVERGKPEITVGVYNEPRYES